jgi:hypothetical protein
MRTGQPVDAPPPIGKSMKSLFRAALATSALLLSMHAHATAFSFSYTFADQSAVTGTLQGDLAGDYVNNISDLHVFFNHVAFTGPLLAAGYDSAIQDFSAAISPVLSTNAALNNFIFADQDIASASNYFYFINLPAYGQEAFAVNYKMDTGTSALDHPAAGAWSLVAQSAEVPEPSSIFLVLGALSVMAVARRRS